MFETNFPKFKFISPAPAKLNPEYRLTLSFSLTTGVKICLGEKVLIKRLDRIKINGKPIPRDKRKSLEMEKKFGPSNQNFFFPFEKRNYVEAIFRSNCSSCVNQKTCLIRWEVIISFSNFSVTLFIYHWEY
jgi:hypothetical protein